MLRILVTLAVLLVAGTAGARPIEDFLPAPASTDWATALERAQLTGETVDLGPGTYPLKRAVNVCRALHVEGQGVGYLLAASRLTTQRSTAFVVRSKADGCPIPELAATPADAGLELEHLVIQNTAGISLSGESPFYGVQAHRPIVLIDVGFRGFVHGVDFQCDAKASGTNCNGNVFLAVAPIESEHAGMYLIGGDTNASGFFSVRADSNCSNAAAWNARFTAPVCSKYPKAAPCVEARSACAGIFDASFLGNTYVASETATERQIFPRGSTPVDYAGMVLVGSNQDGTVVGAYVENNAAPASADSRSTILGGSDRFGGSAGQLHGMRSTGLVVTNGDLELKLGGAAGVPSVAWTVGTKPMGAYVFKLGVDKTNALTMRVGEQMPYGVSLWTPPK